MSNVQSLHGAPIQSKEPNAEMVERLEMLLEMAKSGEASGIVYACYHQDETVSYGGAGQFTNHMTLGAITAAQTQLARELFKAD